MKPVNQTRFRAEYGSDAGDCFGACIASMLEVELDDELSGLMIDEDWRDRIKKRLAPYGIALVCFRFPSREDHAAFCETMHDEQLVIYLGPSPLGTCGHAVVGNVKGKILHDPHTSRLGLKGEPWQWEIGLFVPFDPATMLDRLRNPNHI